MSEDPFAERLKRLEDRITAARAPRAEPKSLMGDKVTQSSLAWRMVTELVAGMLLGLGIGWGLDTLLGTLPVFLIVFVLLGFAAGVRVMMRTAEDVRQGRSEGALMRRPGPAGDKAPDGAWNDERPGGADGK